MTEETQPSNSEPVDLSTEEETQTRTAGSTPVVKTAAPDDEAVTEPPTLRDFFGVPEKVGDKGDDHLKAFQERLAEETRDIKWTAAMPELGSKIADLLDIKIHD